MGASKQKPAIRRALLLRFFMVACVPSLLLQLLCTSSKAETVLIFGQINANDVVTMTNNGMGTTTLSTAGNADGGGVSIPVTITTFLGVPGVNIPAFETFVGVTSTSAATLTNGVDTQTFSGKIEFTSNPGGAGFNYLTATFANIGPTPNSFLSGADGSRSAGMQASEPYASLTFTSSFANFAGVVSTSMSLSFVNLSNKLAIYNGSIGSKVATTMQNAGDFAAVAPEPSNLAVVAIGALGMVGYGLRRRKAPVG